jgi:hypothetical protein
MQDVQRRRHDEDRHQRLEAVDGEPHDPTGMSSDEAMSRGWRRRKFRSANVAEKVANMGPPTMAVTPG